MPISNTWVELSFFWGGEPPVYMWDFHEDFTDGIRPVPDLDISLHMWDKHVAHDLFRKKHFKERSPLQSAKLWKNNGVLI